MVSDPCILIIPDSIAFRATSSDPGHSSEEQNHHQDRKSALLYYQFTPLPISGTCPKDI